MKTVKRIEFICLVNKTEDNKNMVENMAKSVIKNQTLQEKNIT